MSRTERTSAAPPLDINGLAEQLGISVSTLYRWRSDGNDMPRGFRVGGRVRWRQEEVDRWIEAQEQQSAIA